MHEFRLSIYMAIIHEASSANNDFLVCFRIVSLFSLSLKLFLLRSVFHSFVAANSHPQSNIHGAMVAKIPKPFQPPEHMDGFFNPYLKKINIQKTVSRSPQWNMYVYMLQQSTAYVPHIWNYAQIVFQHQTV